MRIGEASRLTGSSVRALRHFEDEGLIAPGRTPNGYRDFCLATVESARAVRALIDKGLPTRIVRELLPHLPGAAVTVPDSPCDHLVDLVTAQRDAIDQRIAALIDRREALEGYLTLLREARAVRA